MESQGILSLLAGQALEASARAINVRARGGDEAAIRSIERSLRQTMMGAIKVRDGRGSDLEGFDLRVGPEGGLFVRHAGRALPVRESYLRSLLEEAGVRLRPGQVIMLDGGIVEMLVDEALGALRLEEADRQDARSRLVAARDALRPPLSHRR